MDGREWVRTDTKKRIPFAFLADVSQNFHAEIPNPRQWQTAQAYELNDRFGRRLAERTDFFSNNPSADKIGHLQAQIEDVKGVMVENIEKVLERGERIEVLVDRTDQLNSQAQVFQKRSTQLKRAMWWQNMKMQLLLGFVCILIIFIIIWAACGISFQRCKKK